MLARTVKRQLKIVMLEKTETGAETVVGTEVVIVTALVSETDLEIWTPRAETAVGVSAIEVGRGHETETLRSGGCVTKDLVPPVNLGSGDADHRLALVKNVLQLIFPSNMNAMQCLDEIHSSLGNDLLMRSSKIEIGTSRSLKRTRLESTVQQFQIAQRSCSTSQAHNVRVLSCLFRPR